MFKHHSVPASRKRSVSLGAATVMLAIILSACGQPGTSQADTPAAPSPLAGGSAQTPGSTVLSGKTRVLTPFAGGTLTHLSAEGTLTFERPMILPVRSAGVSAVPIDDVTELKPGDVLVTAPTNAAPYGFMRKVERVGGTNGAVVVTTSPATLDDAIKGSGLPAGEYKTTKAIPTDRVIAESVIGEDGELAAQGLPTFGNERTEAGFYSIPLPQQGLKSLGNIGVGANECIKIKTLGSNIRTIKTKLCYELYASITIDSQIGYNPEPYLDRFSTTFSADTVGTVDFTVESALKFFKAKQALANITFAPVLVFVGDIPIVIVPTYKVSLSETGKLTASLTASLTAKASAEISLKYSNNEWKGDHKLSGGFGYRFVPKDTRKASLDFKISFDNSADLLFYGLVGPSFKLSTYYKFVGRSDLLTATGKATGGIEGSASIDSIFYDTPLTFEYPIFKKEIILGSF